MTTPPAEGNGDGFEVGYRKPPKHTQFQKGRSGNPRGRPKGVRNVRTELFEELHEWIVVREGGKTRRVTKLRALWMSLTARGLQSDTPAARLVIATATQFEADESSSLPAFPTLEQLLERLSELDAPRPRKKEDSDETP